VADQPTDNVRTSRGISRAVWDARGYAWYAKGDPEPIFKADGRLRTGGHRKRIPEADREITTVEFEEYTAQVRGRTDRRGGHVLNLGSVEEWKPYAPWIRSMAAQSSGWVMPKFGVLTPEQAEDAGWEVTSLPKHGAEVPSYSRPLAQLRPDKEIQTATWGHAHGGMTHKPQWKSFHPPGPCSICVNNMGRPVKHGKNGVMRPDTKPTCPCGVKHSPDKPPGRDANGNRTWYERPMPKKAARAHEEGPHHVAQADDPERGIEAGDLIQPFTGKHRAHRHRKLAKYLLTPGESAKRLDAHPWAREMFEDAELFWFVLESNLKADALLTYALKHERRWGIFDTASVTTWDTAEDVYEEAGKVTLSELRTFTEVVIRDRPVVVVADSDWSTNDAVRRQTARVVGLLAEYHTPAISVAPPEGPEMLDRRGRPLERHEKVGLDG
jgi:hypothetical protein